MKLYSRAQLILFTMLCITVTIAGLSVLGLIKLPLDDDRFSDEYRERVSENYQERGQVYEGIPAQFDESSSNLASRYSDDEIENILIYKELNEAVVNITTISFSYNWFLEPVPEEGTGSGSIIDRDGTIITNYHVIKGAKELHITLADGSDYKGKVVGIDSENDLALIKIDAGNKKLTVIPFGTSATLLVGQKVIAIGNPFALQRTLTTGIVSGLGRPIKTNEGTIIEKMIQTDASINPGNSGGPLLDSKGRMIGINTMIYSPSGGSVGIGFAVPIDTAIRVIPDLIAYGKVKRGWIDITPVQIFPQLVRYAGLPVSQGILVSEVKSGGNAEKAGLKGGNRQRAVRAGRNIIYLDGDIIVEVDGTEIKSLADLYSALEDNKPGETVMVVVLRGRTRKNFQVILSERS